jgi:uncharacterized protein
MNNTPAVEATTLLSLPELVEKAEGDGPHFRAIASAYGVLDRDRDVIVFGAFKDAELPVPILVSHDRNRPVGTITSMVETTQGLVVEGRFSDTDEGRDARELVRSGALPFLSVGIRFVPGTDTEDLDNGVRVIKRAELLEISVVPVPANPGAKVLTAKALDTPDTTDTTDTDEIPVAPEVTPVEAVASLTDAQITQLAAAVADELTARAEQVKADEQAATLVAEPDAVDLTAQTVDPLTVITAAIEATELHDAVKAALVAHASAVVCGKKFAPGVGSLDSAPKVVEVIDWAQLVTRTRATGLANRF